MTLPPGHLPMPSFRRFRDPVHGFINIDRRECEIVDLPVLQRLRRVRQLAMAYLVYAGAMHTRFEHTLGVFHVADLLCRHLEIDEDHCRLIRLAALLHDVGHGPFSHVSEDVLMALTPDVGGSGSDKVHEQITRDIIRNDVELRKYLAEKDAEDVIRLLDKGLDQPIYHDVVSGPLDADKQDYLLRDSYYCGVKYGLYDIARFQDVLARLPDVEGDGLVVNEEGLHTLEQFVLARYYLTTQVVRHKVRRITDAMLVRGLTLGVRVDKIGFLQKLYTYEPTQEFTQEFLGWQDDRLMFRLLEPDSDGTTVGRMMRRLADRKLFKVVFQRSVSEFPDLALGAERLAAIQEHLEGEIAEELSRGSGHVVSPAEIIVKVVTAPSAKKSEGSVLLKKANGTPDTFESRSALFKSIDLKLREENLECYAPVDEPDEARRRALKTRIDELVVRRVPQLLSSVLGSGAADLKEKS